VNLGPVESASSFVTPTVKKERMVTVKMERMAAVKMESISVEIEATKRKAAGNDDVVDLCSQNLTKKSRPPAADEDVEVTQIDDDDDDDFDEDESPNICDLLSNTCDFTPAANKKESPSNESSDGGETILGVGETY
jgi:hypothetical protein